MNNFYILDDPEDLPENHYTEYTDSVNFEQIVCSKTKGHYRPGKRITKLSVVVPSCNNDIIWTWYHDCLINKKVVSLLKDNNISGYILEDVFIARDKRKGKSFNKKLYNLVVVGNGGNIHPSSGYKIIEVCEQCGSKKKQDFTNGLIVDYALWDKSDIITVKEYPKYFLVTEKVKSLFENNRITGCVFIPSEKKD